MSRGEALVKAHAARARWRELGVGDGDAAAVHQALIRRLLLDHEVMAAAYPVGRDLIAALAGLHEVENLKLVWRAVRRRIAAPRWTPFWRPLGHLATLRLEDWADVRSPTEFAERAARGPYIDIAAAAAMRARDAEAVFDRFASRRIVAAARALPRREAAARELALALVRERDLDMLRRAPSWGLPPDLAAAACALLPDEMRARDLEALAARPGELDARLTAARGKRLTACRRAFLGPPFRLAPAVALLLLAAARAEDIIALVERAAC